MTTRPLSVGIFGAGALGSYLGIRLSAAGMPATQRSLLASPHCGRYPSVTLKLLELMEPW